MITLLHGDHIEASRAQLHLLKTNAQGREIRFLDGRSITSSILVQSLESSSLFGTETFVVVENLFGKLGRQTKKINEYCLVLQNAGKQTDIVLWEDKELTPGVLKQLDTDVTVRVFKLPVLIFQFLDTVRPGNSPAVLSVYDTLVGSEAPELVFAMLIKRVRQLISMAAGTPPAGLAPWQIGRLTTQAKSFTMSELVSLYEQLGEAEYSLKSGSSPFGLRELVEQVLMTI